MNDELVDVCDELGIATGQVLLKSEVHDKELWHGSAFVWIYNSEGEVLLQLRSANKKIFPSIWDVSAAGHMSAGDTPELAAIRETQEEIGITITKDKLITLGECTDEIAFPDGRLHKEHDWIFMYKKDIDIVNLELQDSELSDVKWLHIDKLAADLKDPESSKQYAKRNKYIYEAVISEIRKLTL